MGEFVYHMVPKEMIGTKLIPLNSLKNPYPHLYKKYANKYFDHPERPKLLKKQVPKLNCLCRTPVEKTRLFCRDESTVSVSILLFFTKITNVRAIIR